MFIYYINKLKFKKVYMYQIFYLTKTLDVILKLGLNFATMFSEKDWVLYLAKVKSRKCYFEFFLYFCFSSSFDFFFFFLIYVSLAAI
jgi:hypothetical protein